MSGAHISFILVPHLTHDSEEQASLMLCVMDLISKDSKSPGNDKSKRHIYKPGHQTASPCSQITAIKGRFSNRELSLLFMDAQAEIRER